MGQIAGDDTSLPQPLRVAIVGNSNSIMMDSFSHMLARDPDFRVTNKSIGSTPSVVLLDFLALENDLDYDFIIMDTAVCDSLEIGKWPAERIQETLEFFISFVRSHSLAQIIMLTIPTRIALLSTHLRWLEALYRDIARRFELPILDGFELIRQLVSVPKMFAIGQFTTRARQLGRAFRLPAHLPDIMAWRNLRDQNLATNALGMFGFNDDLHFSHALHALLSDLLRNFMKQKTSRGGDSVQTAADDKESLIRAAEPTGGDLVQRRNSWMNRDLALLREGETIVYKCPPGYTAFGLLLNVSTTSCFLRIVSPAGTKIISTHYAAQPSPWIARVIPLPIGIGGGDVLLTLADDADAQSQGVPLPAPAQVRNPPAAELAELILVRDDWKSRLPHLHHKANPILAIEQLPSAKPIMTEAAARCASSVRSMESQGRFIDEVCDFFITTVLSNDAPLSFADRARILLVLGKTKQLAEFLDRVCTQRPDDEELQAMQSALRAADAEDQVKPEQLLADARAKVKSGAIAEAEAVYQEGMIRFTSELLFWFEHANLAHQRQDWPEAIRRWGTMRDLFPRHESWTIGLFAAMWHIGQREAAECLIESIVVDFPHVADVAAAHAKVAVDKNDIPEGVRRMKAVRRRFPDHLRNRRALIELLIKHGEFQEARQEVSLLLDEGRANNEVLELAVKLADTPSGFEWIASIWPRLADSAAESGKIAMQAEHLFERFNAVYDCRFLSPSAATVGVEGS